MNKLTAEEELRVRELLNQCMSQAEISRRLGHSRQTIARVARRQAEEPAIEPSAQNPKAPEDEVLPNSQLPEMPSKPRGGNRVPETSEPELPAAEEILQSLEPPLAPVASRAPSGPRPLSQWPAEALEARRQFMKPLGRDQEAPGEGWDEDELSRGSRALKANEAELRRRWARAAMFSQPRDDGSAYLAELMARRAEKKS